MGDEQAVVGRMAEAAEAFLDGLDPQRRAAAQQPFDDEGLRRDWHYVPRSRPGLAFDQLDRGSRTAVLRLVASGLRFHAYAQVAAIMALEDVLDEQEGGSGRRERTDYDTVVFGQPRAGEGGDPWGWRFEGHHVSLNVTVAGGTVSATPCFLGAHPAVVRHGDDAVLRPLAAEEELARAVLGALGSPQRARAVVRDEASADIHTRAQARVEGPIEPRGVAAADLDGTSADLLRRLVEVYLDRLPQALAARHVDRLDREGFDAVHLAWEGSAEPGRPHYYRIQGPGLLVEYDNTQDGANHIHSVWRDPEGDFGADLLASHYARHHPG